MKRAMLTVGVVGLVMAICVPVYATYSVVGANTKTGEVGIAGAS